MTPHKQYVTEWFPVVTNPTTSPDLWTQVFDSKNVTQFHLWMAAASPDCIYNIRLSAYVELDENIEAALRRVGRNPEFFSWTPFEIYNGVHVGRPDPQADWAVMQLDRPISPGWMLVLKQEMHGRVKLEIQQTAGVNRLLLYRLVGQ